MNENEKEYFEERAAIYEYDAGYTREQAEHIANNDVFHMKQSKKHKKEIVQNEWNSNGKPRPDNGNRFTP